MSRKRERERGGGGGGKGEEEREGGGQERGERNRCVGGCGGGGEVNPTAYIIVMFAVTADSLGFTDSHSGRIWLSPTHKPLTQPHNRRGSLVDKSIHHDSPLGLQAKGYAADKTRVEHEGSKAATQKRLASYKAQTVARRRIK